MRSNMPRGRATSPTAPISSSLMRRSGRRGGIGTCPPMVRCASVRSAMLHLGSECCLDLVGEQQGMDAPVQLLEGPRADIGKAQMVGVELRLHPAGMRREHEN